MKRKGFYRLSALALALVFVLGLLPITTASAAPQLEDPNVTYLAEENQLFAANNLVAGKAATLYIPIINRGSDEATNLSCELPYSGDPLAFPFESTTQAAVSAKAYKKFDPAENNGKGALVDWDGSSLKEGERAWFELSGVTALSSLSQGSLQLVFTMNCDGLSAPQQIKMTVYVTNSSWRPPSGGSGNRSKPKVIIESFSFDRDRIYAGDTIRLNISVRNTSSAEAITNLQLNYSSEGGVILPSSGSSNSVFLGEIKKGEAYQLVLFLNIAPDAEAKTYPLAVQLVYESAKNFTEYKEETNIAIPVMQGIRVRLTDPVIYGDPWVGQGISMSLSLYNLSKATIYNCSAEVEGEGLSLEEPFFGGNVSAGGTMRADLSIVPDQAGEVQGQVLISYENVYGEVTVESIDFSIFVNDFGGNGGQMEEPMPMPETRAPRNLGWLVWLLVGLVVAGGAVALIIILRKRRKKFLEEL